MNKKFKIAIVALLAGVLIAGCEGGFDFGAEQFRNEISLLRNATSVGISIFDRQIARLSEDGDVVNIVAGISGTNSPTTPMRVTIAHSETVWEYDPLLGTYVWARDPVTGEFIHVSAFDRYNQARFGEQLHRNANLLPSDRFTIRSMTGYINPGSFQHRFPVELTNLEGLSPDSVYFINVRIVPEESDAFNPNFQEILFRVHWENEIASTRAATNFTFASSTIVNSATGVVTRPTTAVRMFPLSETKTRMAAGNLSIPTLPIAGGAVNVNYAQQVAERSMVVEIGEPTVGNPNARHITIRPFVDEGFIPNPEWPNVDNFNPVWIEQLPPYGHFDNTFVLTTTTTPDGRISHFREFRMHYRFRQGTGAEHVVQAILRQEWNPRLGL